VSNHILNHYKTSSHLDHFGKEVEQKRSTVTLDLTVARAIKETESLKTHTFTLNITYVVML